MRPQIIAAAVAFMTLAACGSGAADTGSPTTTTSGEPSAFAAFDTGAVMVVDGTGERRLSVWVAATEPQRQQGLMNVVDAELEGRAGMAFWFPTTTQGGFWMRNTRLPLTIVFVDDEGGVVSIAEMQPCPDTDPDCPVTRPSGPYRWALEVPTSRWPSAGISPDSLLTLIATNLEPGGRNLSG
jgi:uncharacterized membrane protein (UPF0127 family)